MAETMPGFLTPHIKELYGKHFQLRAEMEDKYFGQADVARVKEEVPVLEIARTELNDAKVEDFIRKIRVDCIFSYGPDLINDNILAVVNDFAFNLARI